MCFRTRVDLAKQESLIAMQGRSTMLKGTTKALIVMSLLQANVRAVLYIAGVAAVTLAGVLFAFVAFFGVPVHSGVEDILLSPYMIDRGIRTDSGSDASQVSPLLRQAAAFAKYLDLHEETSEIRAERAVGEVLPAMPRITPKLRVLATSCFETNPAMSLALIDKPGRGKHSGPARNARQNRIVR